MGDKKKTVEDVDKASQLPPSDNEIVHRLYESFPENPHIRAVIWLCLSSDYSFYFDELKGVQISDVSADEINKYQDQHQQKPLPRKVSIDVTSIYRKNLYANKIGKEKTIEFLFPKSDAVMRDFFSSVNEQNGPMLKIELIGPTHKQMGDFVQNNPQLRQFYGKRGERSFQLSLEWALQKLVDAGVPTTLLAKDDGLRFIEKNISPDGTLTGKAVKKFNISKINLRDWDTNPQLMVDINRYLPVKITRDFGGVVEVTVEFDPATIKISKDVQQRLNQLKTTIKNHPFLEWHPTLFKVDRLNTSVALQNLSEPTIPPISKHDTLPLRTKSSPDSADLIASNNKMKPQQLTGENHGVHKDSKRRRNPRVATTRIVIEEGNAQRQHPFYQEGQQRTNCYQGAINTLLHDGERELYTEKQIQRILNLLDAGLDPDWDKSQEFYHKKLSDLEIAKIIDTPQQEIDQDEALDEQSKKIKKLLLANVDPETRTRKISKEEYERIEDMPRPPGAPTEDILRFLEYDRKKYPHLHHDRQNYPRFAPASYTLKSQDFVENWSILERCLNDPTNTRNEFLINFGSSVAGDSSAAAHVIAFRRDIHTGKWRAIDTREKKQEEIEPAAYLKRYYEKKIKPKNSKKKPLIETAIPQIDVIMPSADIRDPLAIYKIASEHEMHRRLQETQTSLNQIFTMKCDSFGLTKQFCDLLSSKEYGCNSLSLVEVEEHIKNINLQNHLIAYLERAGIEAQTLAVQSVPLQNEMDGSINYHAIDANFNEGIIHLPGMPPSIVAIKRDDNDGQWRVQREPLPNGDDYSLDTKLDAYIKRECKDQEKQIQNDREIEKQRIRKSYLGSVNELGKLLKQFDIETNSKIQEFKRPYGTSLYFAGIPEDEHKKARIADEINQLNAKALNNLFLPPAHQDVVMEDSSATYGAIGKMEQSYERSSANKRSYREDAQDEWPVKKRARVDDALPEELPLATEQISQGIETSLSSLIEPKGTSIANSHDEFWSRVFNSEATLPTSEDNKNPVNFIIWQLETDNDSNALVDQLKESLRHEALLIASKPGEGLIVKGDPKAIGETPAIYIMGHWRTHESGVTLTADLQQHLRPAMNALKKSNRQSAKLVLTGIRNPDDTQAKKINVTAIQDYTQSIIKQIDDVVDRLWFRTAEKRSEAERAALKARGLRDNVFKFGNQREVVSGNVSSSAKSAHITTEQPPVSGQKSPQR